MAASTLVVPLNLESLRVRSLAEYRIDQAYDHINSFKHTVRTMGMDAPLCPNEGSHTWAYLTAIFSLAEDLRI